MQRNSSTQAKFGKKNFFFIDSLKSKVVNLKGSVAQLGGNIVKSLEGLTQIQLEETIIVAERLKADNFKNVPSPLSKKVGLPRSRSRSSLLLQAAKQSPSTPRSTSSLLQKNHAECDQIAVRYAPPAKVVSIEECEKFIQKCRQQIEEEAFNKLHNLCNASSVPKIEPQQAKIRDMMCSLRPRLFSTAHNLTEASSSQPFRPGKSLRNPDEILEKVQNKFDKRESTYLNRNFKTLLPNTILDTELTKEVEKLADGSFDRDKEAKDGKKYCEICNENYDDLFKHQKLTKHEKKME